MAHLYEVHCDCCGLAVDITQVAICPRCQYPVQPEQEQRFLEATVHNLKRVMRYGGASIRVADLAWRYEGRLQFLLNHKGRDATQPLAAPPAQARAETASLAPAPHIPEEVQPRFSSVPQHSVVWPGAAGVTDTSQPVGALSRGQIRVGASQSIAASTATPAYPTVPLTPAASMRGFSFSGDAVVNILAALGGFLDRKSVV